MRHGMRFAVLAFLLPLAAFAAEEGRFMRYPDIHGYHGRLHV